MSLPFDKGVEYSVLTNRSSRDYSGNRGYKPAPDDFDQRWPEKLPDREFEVESVQRLPQKRSWSDPDEEDYRRDTYNERGSSYRDEKGRRSPDESRFNDEIR